MKKYTLMLMYLVGSVVSVEAMQGKHAAKITDPMFEYLIHHNCKQRIMVFAVESQRAAGSMLTKSRKASVDYLYDFAQKGIEANEKKLLERFGKQFKVVLFPNNVDDYKKYPSSKKACVYFEKNGCVQMKQYDDGTDHIDGSSLVIYNMPVYHDNSCFDWAYTDELFDMLYHTDVPCIVNCDKSLWEKYDPAGKIDNRFYGKKKIMVLSPALEIVRYYSLWGVMSKGCGLVGIGALFLLYNCSGAIMMALGNETELNYQSLMA